MTPPTLPSNWERCHAYMEKKKRFCRQQRKPKSNYCGNHQHLDCQCVQAVDHAGKDVKRKRIPCPIDPSHDIFEDQKEKHVLICPRTKKRKRQEQQSYFQENINKGGHGPLVSAGTEGQDMEQISTDATSLNTNELNWAQQLALRILEVHCEIFDGSTKDTDSRQKEQNLQNLSLQDLLNMIPLKDFSQQELDAGMVQGFESNRIKSGGAKHVTQLASLVGNLRVMDVLPPLQPPNKPKAHTVTTTKPSSSNVSNHCQESLLLLEMGAGRGMFGLAAAGVAAANGVETRLIMVERTGSRSKADKIFRSQKKASASDVPKQSPPYLRLDSVSWSRMECDLAHVNLPTVLPSLQDESDNQPKPRIVIIAKHLCGAGTDLALKSLEPIRHRVDSCILATCCHGVCNWEDYVGRKFLQTIMQTNSFGFGPEAFEVMRRWCAASVADGSNISQEKLDPELETSDEHRSGSLSEDVNTEKVSSVSIAAVVKSLQLGCGIQGLGRACQRLIDYGRLEYLQNVIFTGRERDSSSSRVELCHYIPPDISPQNACLLCHRRLGAARTK